MRGEWIILLALLSGCGDERPEEHTGAPRPIPPEAVVTPPEEVVEAAESEVPSALEQGAETPPSESPIAPVAPVRAPPSPAEFDLARQACSDAFTELRQGTLEGPRQTINDALAVLRRASESSSQQRILGACLYNHGRAMEESLDIESARVAYEESLEVRPNRIVAERRRRLGTREVDPSSDRLAGIERQLARADGHPCGERRAQCEAKILMYAHSGGGPLLRAAVLAVSEDDELTSLHLAWAGAQGRFQWGPRIGPSERWDDDEGLLMDEPMGYIAFRPVADGEPWHLFVRYDLDWDQACCGGHSEGHERDLVVCELEGDARCVLVAERRHCEGEGIEGLAHYLPCEQDDTQQVAVGPGGLTLSGDRPVNSARYLRTGAHSWGSLFPPRPNPSP